MQRIAGMLETLEKNLVFFPAFSPFLHRVRVLFCACKKTWPRLNLLGQGGQTDCVWFTTTDDPYRCACFVRDHSSLGGKA